MLRKVVVVNKIIILNNDDTMAAQTRVLYDGMMGDLPSVISNGENRLECFECHEKSLYHDAIAYWNEEIDDLLCPVCYGRRGESDNNYEKVLTQH